MTEQYDGRRQKYVSTQFQYCAWERFKQQGKQLNNGEAKWQLFMWKTPSMSYWEWMENQLNSSAKFSEDSHPWKFYTKFYAIWRIPKSNRKSTAIESPFMSMFNDIAIYKKGSEDSCTSTSNQCSTTCMKICENMGAILCILPATSISCTYADGNNRLYHEQKKHSQFGTFSIQVPVRDLRIASPTPDQEVGVRMSFSQEEQRNL